MTKRKIKVLSYSITTLVDAAYDEHGEFVAPTSQRIRGYEHTWLTLDGVWHTKTFKTVSSGERYEVVYGK